MAFGQLITLGGSTLTDEGRIYDTGLDERSVSLELANGSIKKYIKTAKRKHTMNWDWMPGDSSLILDGGIGRDALYVLVYSGGPYQLTVQDAGAFFWQANVTIDSYSENLLRRDFNLNTGFYQVSLILKEV